MLRLIITLQTATLAGLAHARTRLHRDEGQSTAEYALVLLGAAGVAALLVAWATKSNRISSLLNAVLDEVIGRVS